MSRITATQLIPEVAPALLAATQADVPAPVAALPRDSNEPTRAFREASTPGPQAPERATQHETTAPLCEALIAPSRLPPIPGYTLEGFVGKGGMGVVYRARHHATGRAVALKLISPRCASDETARGRFVREVHALAAIKHPNIVPVYDAGEWHGFPYCTMEFVEGGTLSEHLARIRADRDGAVALMAKVARAVERLHAAGILHRDIKPLNILLGEHDEPLVADFGLAKWLDEESDLSVTGLPVGTRPYMAPEQTLGHKLSYSHACDVWALGVTLYEVLTGQHPFRDDGSTDVYHFIRTAEPTPMAEFSPDVPEALQAVVLKCLAKKPEDRYPTAAALADDLDRWLRREPVLAPRPAPATVAPDTPKPRRRTRVAVAALTVALVALGAAMLFHTQSLEKRIAAGKPVRLTDDKGRPLIEPVDEPERGLQRDTWDGYYAFSRNGTGITNFIDVPLPAEYCVEADLAVGYTTKPGCTQVGIYAGRRSWPEMPYRFESIVTATIAPWQNRTTKLQEVRGTLGLYSWGAQNFGSTTGFCDSFTPWDRENTDTTPRFVRVRLEIRADAVRATIDGQQHKPMPYDMFAKHLNCDIEARRRQEHFPAYEVEEPLLGNGIGIYCINNTCVVRNLTVTKLVP